MERVVSVVGHEVRVVGEDGDTFIERLPSVIREPALDYAGLALGDDAIVIDAGANLGVLTLGFSFTAPRGRIVAIEASPSTYQRLVANVEAAAVSNVETLNLAVDESPGTLEFFDSPWFSAGSFVKKETLGSSLHEGSTKVDAETIDDIVERLALDRLDLVKIDVEGHELPALRGARETLRRLAPTVVVEMNLFTITSFANMLPTDYLSEIRALFPFVYDFAPGEGLFAVSDDLATYKSVLRQFRNGRPSDLICRFAPLPTAIETELRRRAADSVDAVVNERVASLESEVAELQEQLLAAARAAQVGSDDARTLRESTSWKVTAPLRWTSDRLHALRPRSR